MMIKNQKSVQFLFLVLFVLLLLSSGAFAVESNNSGPKATVQQLEQEAAERAQQDLLLQQNIDEISLMPGPAGPRGPVGLSGNDGDVGETGPAGPAGFDAPNRTADMCALYQQLSDINLLGSLSIPLYCAPNDEVLNTNIVFVTSQVYNGNLGGLAGADRKCMDSAINAGFTSTYKAWISDAQQSAGERLNHSDQPYVLTNGTVIANNWDDLTDGEISAPIDVNEFGDVVDSSSSRYVYSNTRFDASASQTIAFWTCDNWTKETDPAGFIFGRVGDTESIDNNWSDTYASLCDKNSHLYCIEQ